MSASRCGSCGRIGFHAEDCPLLPKASAVHTDTPLEDVANPMWQTHHEPGSAEENYSRTMRFEKYRAMQQLLAAIANDETPAVRAPGYRHQAKAILAGMVTPRGPAVRSEERAKELERLSTAYRLASGVAQEPTAETQAARTLMVEALKAWEIAHPPKPLDPLLL